MAQEQLSVEVIAEYLGRQAFPAAIADVEKIKKSTEGLTKAQNAQRRAAEEQAKVIRQQRLATAQLGMQFSQISTQMASGTPVATIFAQQIGDVGYALSNMGGILGTVGRIAAGPLGVGLAIAGMAFLSLKGKAKEAEEGTVGFTEIAKSTMIEFGNAVQTIAQQAFAPFGPEIEYVKEKFSELPRFMAKVANVVVQAIAGLTVGVVQTIGNLPGIVKGAIYASINGVIRMINFVMDALAGMANTSYSIVKNLSAKVGLMLPEFQVKFKPFSTKESGLGEIFGNIDAAMAKAVTTTYIDADRILARAPSLVKKEDDKKKKAKKDADDIKSIYDENIADTLKTLDAYSKAYGDTTKENVKIAAEAFAAQQKTQEQMKDFNFAQNMEEQYKAIDRVKSMSESMGQAFSDGIKGMITGAMNFKQVMGNVVDAVINKLFELFVVQQIVGIVSKGISAVTGIQLKPRAIGGPVQSGGAYMVGERGPEMFVPSRNGSIVPNNALGGGMTINVDARGSSDPAAVRAQVEMGIAQAAPYIIAAAQNRTLKTAGRTRLPGTIG